MSIAIKRAYDEPAASDGYRVLVDRLWPRGISKDELGIDEWCKEVAPSSDLRKWFDHDPAKFTEFSALYTAELHESAEPQKLIARVAGDTLTLVYAAKDPTNNHALVLKEYLERLLQIKHR